MTGRTVLQVCQPPDGGVAEHVVRLSAGLRQRGFEPHAAVPPDTFVEGNLRKAGVPVHRLAMGRQPSPSDLGAALSLRRLDRQLRPAIVHAHSSKAGAIARGALWARRPLVYTPHCFGFASAVGSLPRMAYRAVEQALIPRSDAIVAVCEWEQEVAERELAGARSRLELIHNGVPPCPEDEPAAELREFAGEDPLAGLVTVLRPQKDPLLAVRAFAGLRDIRGRLAIIGNGELRDAVAAEIGRLGLHGRARLFPFEGGTARWLHALDLLVLPSRWEALPLAVLEAMACGLPVVAAEVGGVGEAVKDGITGRLVTPGDEAALQRALRTLLSDPGLRTQMGAAGRERWAARFRVEPMVDAVADLYERLLA